MHPSTALATVLVDELVRGGVREAVLSPGSRSAPLAFALHEADRLGRLRLHVRIDERTAGFLALGLAKRSGRPVPVVTTSGTAAVNLHPAVAEAAYSGVPLLAVTADRPPELRGIGANQTIEQALLYGDAVELFAEIGPAERAVGQVAAWREQVRGALGAASAGPVHLDVALREPLVPDGDPSWPEPLVADGPATGTAFGTPPASEPPADELRLPRGPRTVVVAGDGAGPGARRLAELAGWPLLAEPTSGSRSGPNAVATNRLLLGRLGPAVERVVVLGRPTLSRPVTRLLAREDVDVVVVRSGRRRSEVRRPGARLVGAVSPGWLAEDAPPRAEPDTWLRRWLDADKLARAVVSDVLDHSLSGPAVARVVAAALPAGALLVAGSSAAVRDLDLASPREDVLVLANRGASGIDGTVSTAYGAALVHDGPGYALLGDLTFLHDGTGLLVGPDEPRPDLTLVVNNDDGGGIFGQLEQGAPEHAAVFERVFGTPHGADLAALCAATGTRHTSVDGLPALRHDLAAARPGVRVVEIRTDRAARRALDRRLRDAVDEALPG